MRIRLLSAAALLAFVTAPAFAGPVTYKLDPAHTNVLAQWSHFGFSNPFANFGQVEGAVVYDPDNVGNSSVQVTLPLSGLEAFSPKFNEHLRSADFFDADQFPEITFVGKGFDITAPDAVEVTGDLTIKGSTQSVTIPFEFNGQAKDPFGNTRVGFEGSVDVNRRDFGLTWNAALETGGLLVSDKVRLEFDVSAIAGN